MSPLDRCGKPDGRFALMPDKSGSCMRGGHLFVQALPWEPGILFSMGNFYPVPGHFFSRALQGRLVRVFARLRLGIPTGNYYCFIATYPFVFAPGTRPLSPFMTERVLT